MNSHIYILILNWNGKNLLKPCLDSILDIDYDNYTTLVIDNNSTDGSSKMIKNRFPNVEYLQLEKNYGFAGGYNRCFDYLRDKDPEYILLLNNDTEIEPDILSSFIKAAKHYGNQNIFGGKIFYHHNPKKIWYAGGHVNLKYGRIYHRGIHKNDSEKYSFNSITDYVTGCCLFTTWDVIEKIQGFDDQFNMYGEDVDLCLRAKRKDVQCFYWPDAKLLHHVSASVGGNWSPKKIISKFKSLFRLWIKHFLFKSSHDHG